MSTGLTEAEREALRRPIAEHLAQISEMFKPGVRLTLVARNPNYDNADLIVTEDEGLEILKTVERLMPSKQQAGD